MRATTTALDRLTPIAFQRPASLARLGRRWREQRLDAGTPPDQVLRHPNGDTYLRRWHLYRDPTGAGNLYLHCFHTSDPQVTFHDHPWDWLTVVLDGHYREHRPDTYYDREAGDVGLAFSEQPHWIELLSHTAWTLFITGPKCREWGFLANPTDPASWTHWQDYLGLTPA